MPKNMEFSTRLVGNIKYEKVWLELKKIQIFLFKKGDQLLT